MDRHTKKVRSENMRRIRSKDTRPELAVRRIVHSLGYRYRLHRKDIPGRPDMVFPGRRKVIFVHGCFWHQHAACGQNRVPKSNRNYWTKKLRRNKERDVNIRSELFELQWESLVIWECEVSDAEEVIRQVTVFLGER